MEVRLFYVTCKDKQEAESIAKTLLEEKLVACANIFPEMESFFWWKQKIDKAKETPMILKTKKELSKEVIEKIKSLHSYECPCIIEIPITGGFKDFLNWIYEETK
ncbi:divalent-cation tolerance protein CutA [Desulfothermus okinawensis JCM 13304]